jgi:hypothetical protein
MDGLLLILSRLVFAAVALISIDALIGTVLAAEPTSHLAMFCLLLIIEIILGPKE